MIEERRRRRREKIRVGVIDRRGTRPLFKINIERVEMIALSTHSGDRSYSYAPRSHSARGGTCRPIREDRIIIRPTTSLTGGRLPQSVAYWHHPKTND